MSDNNQPARKKGGKAAIASMNYGMGGSLNVGGFGTGQAARSLISGPLANTEAKIVQLNLIESNPNQPRTYFDKEKLEELAADIKERGILQPPVVREKEEGRYEIVAGERRCRAAKMAGLTEIPVIIKEFDNEQQIKLASLAENLQRDDLDIEDEIRFLNILAKELDISLRDIGKYIHRSHLYVYRRLKVGEVPELIEFYRNGQIGMEALVKIAEIKDENERARAIMALRAKNLSENQASNKEAAIPDEQNVTARNTLKPIAKLSQVLSNLEVTKLKKDEKQQLADAIQDLEGVIAEVKRKLR